MNVHTEQSLVYSLRSTLTMIDQQITAATKQATQMKIPVAELRDRNGSWVMNELLVARAQCLQGLTLLKVSKTTTIQYRNNKSGG